MFFCKGKKSVFGTSYSSLKKDDSMSRNGPIWTSEMAILCHKMNTSLTTMHSDWMPKGMEKRNSPAVVGCKDITFSLRNIHIEWPQEIPEK